MNMIDFDSSLALDEPKLGAYVVFTVIACSAKQLTFVKNEY